ncbi:MAG: tRNA (N(6)-L-threonylcarbamoyladenosine(37)-C(2))-methylthiotransferase MtaB [Candidatus Krumholzibacteriia bacterium]
MNDLTPELAPMPQTGPVPAGGVFPALRVAFWTLGCRLNQYDTEGIRTAMAARLPIEVVSWNAEADLYVLNSCTVTAKADQECRRLARQAKRRHPLAKVVVAGCYAQTQPDVLASMPEIDGVVGNTAKEDIASWLPEVLGDGGLALMVEDFAEDPVFDSPLIDSFSGRSRAFIKIQDGCNLRCTYCLIWKARGPGRSRTVPEVVQQLRLLVAGGYREAILAGIHLGGYGRDLETRATLPGLLRTCLAELPELRIRLSSIHPNEVTPELLGLFTQYPHLRRHLHVSLQSGSDTVLKRMKRPYRGARAYRALGEIARLDADFGIGADVIVGFPGETDEEFEATRRMVAELPFTYLHVFRFSPRPGTPAADLPDQVHPETVTERSAVLRDLAAAKEEAFLRGLIGRPREAVVEAEDDASGFRQATTDNYATVLVPPGRPTGELVTVVPESYHDGKLIARVEN